MLDKPKFRCACLILLANLGISIGVLSLAGLAIWLVFFLSRRGFSIKGPTPTFPNILAFSLMIALVVFCTMLAPFLIERIVTWSRKLGGTREGRIVTRACLGAYFPMMAIVFAVDWVMRDSTKSAQLSLCCVVMMIVSFLHNYKVGSDEDAVAPVSRMESGRV
jgi:hypothetical protein